MIRGAEKIVEYRENHITLIRIVNDFCKSWIQFDRSTGQYYLPQLEEILAVYSVNSGETYVLEIWQS